MAKKVRIETQVHLRFDLEVGDRTPEQWFDLARRHLEETGDWFESQRLSTVLGDGNMDMEWYEARIIATTDEGHRYRSGL